MKLFKLLLIAAALSSSFTSSAQFKLGDALKKAASSVSSPSATEIGAGLKEALEAGVSAGADRLSAKDGFLGNAAVKLLFPPEAQKIEKTLRGLGMNKLCDDFVTSMNRAAEEAAREAKPIFISAIKQMSIKDASNILLGGQKDAATQYFKNVTTSQLKAAFTPVIQSNLEKTGATRYWADVTAAYNKVPLVKKINTDLTDYATQKSVDGLFHEVAEEELKIRTSSGARTSPLLQKVFGYADKSSNGVTIN
ncbi:DUF4197 domain-containing protein [Hufsiella ginkgonis]|uniref:DUF4197 family protein n=1 Tax=Hufsiella ginkgonis TaxID=2695274 RepID=A0A7K1XUL7_9SPHI|nr:DUF4197 domain-containing protein [Hufsiella ginkgonis]MXV14703.1 DUF4197 family protein [Hufsiella ginkgonis]